MVDAHLEAAVHFGEPEHHVGDGELTGQRRGTHHVTDPVEEAVDREPAVDGRAQDDRRAVVIGGPPADGRGHLVLTRVDCGQHLADGGQRTEQRAVGCFRESPQTRRERAVEREPVRRRGLGERHRPWTVRGKAGQRLVDDRVRYRSCSRNPLVCHVASLYGLGVTSTAEAVPAAKSCQRDTSQLRT
ncbi:hypothetical protein [Streptomyces sp. NPDC048590]|uniref:hypothetical protein n=1 Tax=Streptomyces sp. NPDC048590 TaxID=3365574 RepID=UPI0037241A3F